MISPEAFEVAWQQLLADYPGAASYLDRELWPNREQWAWYSISTRFTCGARTSGRVESENRVNKGIGDIKTTLFDLVTGLIKRTESQDDKETLHVRQVCIYMLSEHLKWLTINSDNMSTTPFSYRCVICRTIEVDSGKLCLLCCSKIIQTNGAFCVLQCRTGTSSSRSYTLGW